MCGIVGIINLNQSGVRKEKLKKIINSKCKEIHGPEKMVSKREATSIILKQKKELGWQPKYNLDKSQKRTVAGFRAEDSFRKI